MESQAEIIAGLEAKQIRLINELSELIGGNLEVITHVDGYRFLYHNRTTYLAGSGTDGYMGERIEKMIYVAKLVKGKNPG